MFHILWLPHTKPTREYSSCAFTQKIVKMMKMLDMIGEEYIFYGSDIEESENMCKCMRSKDFTRLYWNRQKEDAFDWNNKEGWRIFNKECIKRINENKKEWDIILNSFWLLQESVSQETWLFTIEMGIWYEGVLNNSLKVFESFAHMNRLCGKYDQTPNDYNTVIPNYFDKKDFKLNTRISDYIPFLWKKRDYICFVWRLNVDKGVNTAVEVAKHLGIKIKVAGQKWNRTIDPYCEYVWNIWFEERQELMWNAICTFVPSQYHEPFGGVSVESLLYGTPVVTSWNGGLSEIIKDGKNWYICKCFMEYVEWVKKCMKNKISRSGCRKKALEKYSLEKVSVMYKSYFNKVKDFINGGNWYTFTP